jgi:hypothetical protein
LEWIFACNCEGTEQLRFSQVFPGGTLRLNFPHFPSHEMLSTAFQICQEPTLESGLHSLL